MKSKVSLGVVLLSVLALFLGTGLACAAEKILTPTELPGGKIVSAEEARSLLGKAAFFDMRSPVNYGKGHIPKAISLPYRQKSGLSPDFDPSLDHIDFSLLPADKGGAVVFYSDGPYGWKSYKAAVLAIRRGYTRVLWLRGGFTDWPAKGFPVER